MERIDAKATDTAAQDLISIIIPVYNVEQYLRECVDSVINQTYVNLEIILVDDGATDSSGQICDEYAKKDARIRVIHKPNGGLSDARNVALDVAQGEWVLFVDSDDYIALDSCSIFMDATQKTKADIIVGDIELFYDGSPVPMERGNGSLHTRESKDVLLDVLYSRVPCYVCGRLFKRSVIGTMRFPIGKLFEDQYYTPVIVSKVQSIAFINNKLYYYRQRAESIVHAKYTPEKMAILDAVEYLEECFAEKDEYIHRALSSRKFGACSSLQGMLYRLKGHEEEKQRVQQGLRETKWKAFLDPHIRTWTRLWALIAVSFPMALGPSIRLRDYIIYRHVR